TTVFRSADQTVQIGAISEKISRQYPTALILRQSKFPVVVDGDECFRTQLLRSVPGTMVYFPISWSVRRHTYAHQTGRVSHCIPAAPYTGQNPQPSVQNRLRVHWSG